MMEINDSQYASTETDISHDENANNVSSSETSIISDKFQIKSAFSRKYAFAFGK